MTMLFYYSINYLFIKTVQVTNHSLNYYHYYYFIQSRNLESKQPLKIHKLIKILNKNIKSFVL